VTGLEARLAATGVEPSSVSAEGVTSVPG